MCKGKQAKQAKNNNTMALETLAEHNKAELGGVWALLAITMATLFGFLVWYFVECDWKRSCNTGAAAKRRGILTGGVTGVAAAAPVTTTAGTATRSVPPVDTRAAAANGAAASGCGVMPQGSLSFNGAAALDEDEGVTITLK